MKTVPPDRESPASSPGSSVVLKFGNDQALKIALVLRWVADVLLSTESESWLTLQKRQRQLLWLAGQFEAAVKAAQPELPPHERPKGNRKLVWCANPGCERALTLEHARDDALCPVCRGKIPA